MGVLRILLKLSRNFVHGSSRYLPALEHDEVSVAGPADVGVVRGLLHVLAGERVGALVLVPGVHLVQALDRGVKLLLVEHREHGEDVLLHQEVEGRLPELEDSLCVEAGVDAHGDIRNLHFLCLDPPEAGTKMNNCAKLHSHSDLCSVIIYEIKFL